MPEKEGTMSGICAWCGEIVEGPSPSRWTVIAGRRAHFLKPPKSLSVRFESRSPEELEAAA